MNSNPVYMGLHLHKCAGTSLQIHFTNSDRNGTWFWHTNVLVNHRQSSPEVEELNLDSRQAVRVIWGHEVNDYFFQFFVGRPIFLFTFLRNPVSRMVSLYKYKARRTEQRNRNLDAFKSFSEFAAQRQNHLCNFILKRFPNLVNNELTELHDRAISVLEKFAFIGLQEDFEAGANRLMKFMKFPTLENKKRHNVDGGGLVVNYSEQEIYDLNLSDMRLYEYVKERYQSSPEPDPKKVIDPREFNFSQTQDDFRGFINIRLQKITDAIVLNRAQDNYTNDNVRRMIYLLLRQFSIETNSDNVSFYKQMLLQLAERHNIDITEEDVSELRFRAAYKSQSLVEDI